MKKNEIKKKYSELISKAKFENDRKEVLFLVKKAAKLRSKFEITNYRMKKIILNVKIFIE